jgi:4-hydroxybenzoate polyprenyltransferase
MVQPGTAVRPELGVHPQEGVLGNRWWIYQKERFPLAALTPALVAFSFAAVGYSALARGSGSWPGWRQTVVAFASSLLFFLQLRLADEFKDYEDDLRYRRYRPVPRGLVKLWELALIWAGCAGLQLLLALWLSWRLLSLLGITWAYLLMMSKEFFVPNWLKRHAVVYMVTHMVIMPLIYLYANACDWLVAGYARPSRGLAWMLAVNYFNGMVMEIGRKIRVPDDEEPGVETYSFLWGRRNAVLVWLGAMTAAAVVAYVAARDIHFTQVTAVLPLPVLLASGTAGVVFLAHSKPGRGKWIDTASSLWALVMYLSLGAVPLLLHWYGGQK